MMPTIVFRKMTFVENVNIIKWAFFCENNGTFDVKKYTLNYFPNLKNINEKMPREEIEKIIEETVAIDYKNYEKRIEEEAQRYNDIWSKYNDPYMIGISNYLNVKWPEGLNTIDASVGLIPVFPRYLDTFSFAVSTGLKEDKIIETCAHESLHFIWFEKWKQLYPNCPRREYDSPYIPWQYSEMITDEILNSKEIYSILQVRERAYDSFYELKDGQSGVMDNLANIWREPNSIEEKIQNGYEYISSYKNDNRKTVKQV